MDGLMPRPAKRSRSEMGSKSTDLGGGKERLTINGSNSFIESSKSLSDDVVYRILCPSSKIGSVIGKGGSIIKSLRQETGVKIKVEDGLPGADERVVVIATSGNRNDGSIPSELEALFKVHSRIVGEENFYSEVDEDASNTVTTRLLVPHSQVGCLIGKGGKVIEQMRAETAAQIRILPKEQLPSCALPDDELVQIVGDRMVVKRALDVVGTRLYDNPAKDRHNRGTFSMEKLSGGMLSAGPLFPQGDSLLSSRMGGSLSLTPSLSTLGAGSWPYVSSDISVLSSMSGSYESQKDVPKEEFVIRVLCPKDKIGSIIGKGGSLIRQMREESHAKIKIEDLVPDSDEHVITISALEAANSPVSATLEATLRLQNRIADLTLDKDTGNSTTRLLVPNKNIGCLLGKGGSVITEMRKLTSNNIRVMPKTSLPKCADELDELVQIVDNPNTVRDAVIEIVLRLRDNLFKEYLKSIGRGRGSTRDILRLGREGTTFDLLQESRFSDDLHQISALDVRTAAHPAYGTSTGTWRYQDGIGSGGLTGLGALSTLGSSTTKSSVFYGRPSSLMTSVASKTLEIAIPPRAVGAVLGKGGNNIAHIRQVSGAKVKLHDNKPGSSECIIEISGTPAQTQTAQSLLEAFINSESSF